MGRIDFCNRTDIDVLVKRLKETPKDIDVIPLYTYLCPVIIFICFFSITFNAILITISRQSQLVNKSPILLLSLNLAVTDLIASLLNGLSILFNSYLHEVYEIHLGQCSSLIFEVIRCAALVASALHLLALAFVHYRGIVNPLHYRTINIISIACWIIPLTIMIALFSTTPCQGFTYRYVVLTLFALPLLLMSVIYLRIFIIISKHQKGRRLNHERSTLSRGVISASGPIGTAASMNLPELIHKKNLLNNNTFTRAVGGGGGGGGGGAGEIQAALEEVDDIDATEETFDNDDDADADDQLDNWPKISSKKLKQTKCAYCLGTLGNSAAAAAAAAVLVEGGDGGAKGTQDVGVDEGGVDLILDEHLVGGGRISDSERPDKPFVRQDEPSSMLIDSTIDHGKARKIQLMEKRDSKQAKQEQQPRQQISMDLNFELTEASKSACLTDDTSTVKLLKQQQQQLPPRDLNKLNSNCTCSFINLNRKPSKQVKLARANTVGETANQVYHARRLAGDKQAGAGGVGVGVGSVDVGGGDGGAKTSITTTSNSNSSYSNKAQFTMPNMVTVSLASQRSSISSAVAPTSIFKSHLRRSATSNSGSQTTDYRSNQTFNLTSSCYDNNSHNSTYEPQRRHIHASAVPQTNTKALVTTLLILGTYFISYIPAIVMQVLTCVDYCPYPLYDVTYSKRVLFGSITLLLLIGKSIIDPFIYSYRMSEIHVAVNRYISQRRSKHHGKSSSIHANLSTNQRLNVSLHNNTNQFNDTSYATSSFKFRSRSYK